MNQASKAMTHSLQQPTVLTIYEAAAFHQFLAGELQTDAPLTLDLSGVSEIDTSALQILIWAQREALQRGKPLSLTRPSACVLEFMALSGLGRELYFEEDGA